MSLPGRSLLASAAILATALLVAAVPQTDSGAKVKVELRLAEFERGKGLIEAKSLDSEKKIYLHKEVLVTNQDIVKASVEKDIEPDYIIEAKKAAGIKIEPPSNEPFKILVKFTREAGERLAKATAAHIGKPIAVLIDGKVISAPVVQSQFQDGAYITGQFTRIEAERIANALNNRSSHLLKLRG